MESHNRMPIQPDDKIKPWLQGQLAVLVAQDLEAKRGALAGGMARFARSFRVQTADKTIEGAEHGDMPWRSLVWVVEVYLVRMQRESPRRWLAVQTGQTSYH